MLKEHIVICFSEAMNENRIISWEEAERILQDSSNQPVKSSLPEQTRPTEPDNDTDVEKCIQRLLDNDPTLKEINLNNMKVENTCSSLYTGLFSARQFLK